MTLDQLDSLVWRLITGMYAGNLKPPAVAEAILDAAEKYAEGKAHQAALETALSKSSPRPGMHWQVLTPWAGPACDPPSGKPCTTDRARVTCGACKQTSAWKKAA